MKAEELAIPIYLDTNTLVDLLASIEGGFSIVEKVNTSSSASKSNEVLGSGDFGINTFLSIFKIDLKGSAARNTESKSAEERQTERYHTYGSLLNKLRANLVYEKLLIEVNDKTSWDKINSMDFVEVRGKFVPNPLRNSMQIIMGLIDIVLSVSQIVPSTKSSSSTDQNPNLLGIREILGKMKEEFEHGNAQTYIVEMKSFHDHKLVVSLFSQYIRDHSGRELPYGEFRILGKVIRKIDSNESVDLLQGSAFSGLSEPILSKLFQTFREMSKSGITVPDIVTKIQGPLIQVIPIAVYV